MEGCHLRFKALISSETSIDREISLTVDPFAICFGQIQLTMEKKALILLLEELAIAGETT